VTGRPGSVRDPLWIIATVRVTGAITFVAQIAGWLLLGLELSGLALLVSAAAMGVAGVLSDLRRNTTGR
jgi:hypothetical protein